MIKVDQIVADARQKSEVNTTGADPFQENLTILVDALNNEARLSEAGEQRVIGTITNALANRLKVEKYLEEHPELLERPVEKPLFVFGLPRTGTTLAINLLNEDPANRSLLRWEAVNSVPPPKAGTLSTDPRCQEAQAMVDMALKYAPHISAIHHEDADSPTECQFAMLQTFCAQYYDSVFDVPSYHKWFLQADYLPTFRYHKRLLQVLQSKAPGRWTLKNPWHPLFLDALTEVYPDAQLVMTHRDPVDVVASACSLIKVSREMFSEELDPEAMGRMMIETFDVMIERSQAFREKHGEDSIYDLQYSDMVADPIGEVKKIYEHFGTPWTEDAESAMQAYMDRNPKGKHGKHTYSLEDYGLTREYVREHFSDYCKRFNIPQKD